MIQRSVTSKRLSIFQCFPIFVFDRRFGYIMDFVGSIVLSSLKVHPPFPPSLCFPLTNETNGGFSSLKKSTNQRKNGDFFPGAWKDRHLLLSSKTHLIYVAARAEDSADAKVIWMCGWISHLFFTSPLKTNNNRNALKKKQAKRK